jgi:hypothetical protein
MSWLSTIGVALVTATVGMFVSGYVANLAVGWYRVSGFEGGSGYFMVALALLGLVVGAVVGIVVARIVAAGANPGFFKAQGIALATILALVAIVGGTARAMADVPPEIDGETLLLAVELRWPPGGAPAPVADSEPYVRLGSVTGGHVQRTSERGALWLEDAHLVEGRWVAPGAVRVFTGRGARSLEFHLDDATHPGFLVPLPARPSRKQMAWSEWMPRARPGAPPLPNDRFTFRFRIIRSSEPVRTETVGPFEVQTIASAFYDDHGPSRPTVLAASAGFALRHGGAPYVIEGGGTADATQPDRFARADGVATLGGAPSALLVHVEAPSSSGYCYMLTGDAARARAVPVGECLYPFDATELTNDTARFRAARTLHAPRGRIDRVTFAHPGLYLMHDVVLDTRTLAVRRFTSDPNVTPIPSVPPLGVSPDERSIVRFGYANGSEAEPCLVVTDVVTDTSYTLAIDPARMRFQKLERLDPAWLAHHFAWQREAGGTDRLAARPQFTPLPYRGDLSTEADGRQSYWLEPVRDGLRPALIELLVAELHAEVLPHEEGAYTQLVRIDGRTIEVSYGADSHYVNVATPRSDPPSPIVARIAERFDAALATGRYDAFFGK